MQALDQSAVSTLPQPKGLPARAPRQGWPTVAQLSARLYGAYQVDGGSVHLAGCTLEPLPVVHAHGMCIRDEDSTQQPVERFVTITGELLDAATIASLGLGDLTTADKPPRLSPGEQEGLASLGRAALVDACDAQGGELGEGSSTIEITWCRWAAGKLRFTIAAASADLPFADWAARLAPPPFVCPASGQETFHLAATDDGRIVAAEAIELCQESGRRLATHELVTCAASGKKVAPELVVRCPVTQQMVLQRELVPCPVCLLPVSPAAMDDGRCKACQTEPVSKHDPRVCLLLGEMPGLDRWRRIWLAETPVAYVLQSHGMVRRLLVVADKLSLKPLRVAERLAFRPDWIDAPRERWPEILGQPTA